MFYVCFYNRWFYSCLRKTALFVLLLCYLTLVKVHGMLFIYCITIPLLPHPLRYMKCSTIPLMADLHVIRDHTLWYLDLQTYVSHINMWVFDWLHAECIFNGTARSNKFALYCLIWGFHPHLSIIKPGARIFVGWFH